MQNNRERISISVQGLKRIYERIDWLENKSAGSGAAQAAALQLKWALEQLLGENQ